MDDIVIRKYEPKDRDAVRRISYATAFLGRAYDFVGDAEILSDGLMDYFTEYEPESLFVAADGEKIAGYLTGARSARAMHKILFNKIYPRIFGKALSKGFFLQRKVLLFMWHSLISFVRGEFRLPDFTYDYPATFHINLDEAYRGQRIGQQLIDRYVEYLKENNIKGVYVSTFSEKAKAFFVRNGFRFLFSRPRGYLRYRLGTDTRVHILGREL